MEEIKKLTIPEGYEFDRVENGEVILKKKEQGLPRTYDECLDRIIACRIFPRVYAPRELNVKVDTLCKLLVCRNAWWEHLGWNPDWSDDVDKYCIYYIEGKVDVFALNLSSRILAFPNMETAKEFYEAFKDLIEEAKELL